MALSHAVSNDESGLVHELPGVHADSTLAVASAVSWGAIVAGAATAAALSLILLILGTGLGLSSASPWTHHGIGAATFGVSTILWVTFTQIAASGMGGYLAGRLRTRWLGVHTDEVYFRDTAHGLLAWAVASLATAALLTSVIGSIVSGGIQVGAEMAKPGSDNGPISYFVDSLFRKDMSMASAVSAPAAKGAVVGIATEQPSTAPLSEVTRIFMHAIPTAALSVEDVRYVGQVVARHAGLTQQVAEKRVSETYARVQEHLRTVESAAKDAAEKVAKTSAYAALWLFISLLIGAFVASLAATYGGRCRDA
jgi:hypothetical protein